MSPEEMNKWLENLTILNANCYLCSAVIPDMLRFKYITYNNSKTVVVCEECFKESTKKGYE